MITSRAERIGGVATEVEKQGGISSKAYRYGGIFCRMFQEVRTSLDQPYLEIAPTFLWVLAGQSSDNKVFSNTSWNVD